jgi:hypothetical protein
MISLLRYNWQIVAPTMIWTGILVLVTLALILFSLFRDPTGVNAEAMASHAEQTIPLIAAFLAGGVLDAEMKRGAHELLRSKRRPLWHTVAYRLGVSVFLALLIGAGLFALVHFGIKKIPVGMLLLAATPPALCLGVVSLWTRIRLGNAFIGYMVALAVWLANVVLGLLRQLPFPITINPLLTMTSFTDRLHAEAAGTLLTTPYVDWWWVSKIALVVVAGGIFAGITRRVENLVEGD